MAGFFYAFHRALRLRQSLGTMVVTAKWLALKKNSIMTRAEKDIKDDIYWKKFYYLLCTIWPVLKLLQISDLNKLGMDRIYQLLYKAHCAI